MALNRYFTLWATRLLKSTRPVISAFTHCDQTYILMERIKGDMIGVGWVQRNEESKATLLSKLKSMIQEMREIPAPKGTE